MHKPVSSSTSARKMADQLQLVVVEFYDDQSNPLGFVERNILYSNKAFIRRDIEDEINDLLPNNYKILKKGLPVSRKQEDAVTLQGCAGLVDAENPKHVKISLKSFLMPTAEDNLAVGSTCKITVKTASDFSDEDTICVSKKPVSTE